MPRLYCKHALIALMSLLVAMPAGYAKQHAGAGPATADEVRSVWAGESGVASYYGEAHSGRRTAGGTIFDPDALTAAHPWLPFGTMVRVTVAATGRSVVVVVTDRLPSSRRIVDLSLGAARSLGMIRQGIARVSLSPA